MRRKPLYNDLNMKKYAVAAILSLLSLCSYADTGIGTSIIPENVTSVDPQPGQRVNLGISGSPLGLQYISVMFKRDVAVNPECEGEACIYLHGDDTPLQTVGVSGATVDYDQHKMGCVLFPFSCVADGLYRVTIPEGFWILQGDTPAYSGAFDLYYEVYMPQRISPAEQVVKELSEFRLEFPDFEQARLLSSKKIEFYRHSSPDVYPLTVTEGTNDDGSPANYILIKLREPVKTQGEYSLFIKAGAAEGVNAAGTGEETTDVNMEALYTYTLSQIDPPSIVPEEGAVESFVPFELTVPKGAEFWFVNDRAVSFIYPVNGDGSLARAAAYRLTTSRKEESDVITLTINENGRPADNIQARPGKYALQLASGLFSGSWNGEFINSAPFIYYYQIVSTPEGVEMNSIGEGQALPGGVYTLDGRKIANGAETIGIEALPGGVYVIDGKKKYIGK